MQNLIWCVHLHFTQWWCVHSLSSYSSLHSLPPWLSSLQKSYSIILLRQFLILMMLPFSSLFNTLSQFTYFSSHFQQPFLILSLYPSGASQFCPTRGPRPPNCSTIWNLFCRRSPFFVHVNFMVKLISFLAID